MKKFLTVPVLLLSFITITNAQPALDVLRLSSFVPGQDAHSIGLASSSVAQYQGFGSHISNPASPALSDRNSLMFGVGNRNISQESTFIGQTSSFQDLQYSFTHLGFDYKGSTTLGNLAVGGGYTQTSEYNRAFSLRAFNDLTSRSFQFPTDYTADIALDAYALDYNQDGELYPVLGFGEFVGVDQNAQITQRGHSGEYGLYLAAEFHDDFYLGLSVGMPVSRYAYSERFIETAHEDYTGETDSGNFNVDQIIFEERSEVNASGLNARIGFVYTGLSMVDLGASYTTVTRWDIESSVEASVQTRFAGPATRDGVQQHSESVFEMGLEQSISYRAVTPASYQLGATLKSLPGLLIALSAEHVNYSTINLSDFQSRAAGERPGLSIPGGDQRQLEIHENNFVRDEFKPVWNFRGGLTYNLYENIEPRLGYARLDNPARFKENNIRQYVSAGVGIGIHEVLRLDLGVQYGFWKETDSLYTVDEVTGIIEVDGDPVTFTETADQDVRRFHATIGLSIRL